MDQRLSRAEAGNDGVRPTAVTIAISQVQCDDAKRRVHQAGHGDVQARDAPAVGQQASGKRQADARAAAADHRMARAGMAGALSARIFPSVTIFCDSAMSSR